MLKEQTMHRKMAKSLGLGLALAALLFGLFFCMNNDRANSLTNAKAKDDKEKMTTAKSLGRAFVEVAKKVQPAVVNITTEKTITMKPWDRYGEDFFKVSPFEDFFKGFGFSPREKGKEFRHKQRSGGSGVIVDKEGYILTNNHVVEDTDKIKVRLNDGREFTATLKGQDSRTLYALPRLQNEWSAPERGSQPRRSTR